LQELKSMVDELWRMDGTGAVDLRRQLRTYIDEVEHVVWHEQIGNAMWEPQGDRQRLIPHLQELDQAYRDKISK